MLNKHFLLSSMLKTVAA